MLYVPITTAAYFRESSIVTGPIPACLNPKKKFCTAMISTTVVGWRILTNSSVQNAMTSVGMKLNQRRTRESGTPVAKTLSAA